MSLIAILRKNYSLKRCKCLCSELKKMFFFEDTSQKQMKMTLKDKVKANISTRAIS